MRRRSVILAAALAAAIPTAVAGTASAATTSPTTKYYLPGGTTPVKGITVSGFDGRTVYFAVTSNVGTQAQFRLGRTAGLSLPFGYAGYSGASIAFTGTQDAVNAALKTLTVTTGPAVTPLLNVILRRPDGTLERQDQPNPPLPGTPLR